MLNPDRVIMKRWLSRYSNLGTVSLDYQLSDQPTFGNWTIQVLAQGQTEESSFSVEEYYQTRFEVNITMPAFFFTTDEYVHGVVMANYTSGVPVRGNLTLKATIRPIRPVYLRPEMQAKNRPRYRDRNQYTPYSPYSPYGNRDQNYYNNEAYGDNTGSYNRPVVEKYFNFVS